MKFKFFLLIFSLFIFGVTAKSENSKDTLKLSNAYQVAKLIVKYKNDTTKFIRQQLLGSVLWYANQQDQESGMYSNMMTKVARYRQLSTILKPYFNNLVSIQLLFDKNAPQIEPADLISPELKSSVTVRLNDYQIAKDSIVKLEDSLVLINNLISHYNSAISLAGIIGPLSDSLQAEIKKKIDSCLNFVIDKSGFVFRNISKYSKVKADLNQIIQSPSIQDPNPIEKIKSILAASDLEKKREEFDTRKQKQTKVGDSKKQEIIDIVNAHTPEFASYLAKLSRYQDTQSDSKKDIILENTAELFSLSKQKELQRIYQTEEKLEKYRIPTESEMISAIAIYLANRVKQEAVIWFFEQLTKNMKTNDLLKIFFPSTMSFLQSREVYEIPNMGSQWRYSLSKDFSNMPRNLLTNDWLKNRWPDYHAYEDYLVGACDIAELLQKKFSYREIIKTMYVSHSIGTEPAKTNKTDSIRFNDLINLLYAINTEFFIPQNDAGFRMLKYEDFRNMNREELEIMLSLVDMKYDGIFTKLLRDKKQVFSIEDTKQAEQIRRWLGQVEIIVSKVESAQIQFHSSGQSNGESGTKDFYTIDNVWSSMDELLHLFKIDATDRSSIFSESLQTVNASIFYVDQVHEIYNQISSKNFSGAVQSLLALVDSCLYRTSDNNKKGTLTIKINDIFDSGRPKPAILASILEKYMKDKLSLQELPEYACTISGRWDKPDEIVFSFEKSSLMAGIVFEKDRHVISMVRTLSGFLNDAALAKDDKQLAKVVESYAMPAGSYKRKRNNWWSLDFNAFVGPYIGYEIPTNVPEPLKNSLPKDGKGWVYGLSAPIGISLSKTYGQKIQEGKDHKKRLSSDEILNPDLLRIEKDQVLIRSKKTITFSLTLVDLGAVVSYRFKNQDSSLTQLKWTQFFSPALHVARSIDQTPLVISTGIQYTPQLRSLNASDEQYNAFRFYVGLYFDIPLFNLWERKRVVQYEKIN